MNQKGFANIIFIVIAVVVVAGALGYVMLVQKPESTSQPTPLPPTIQPPPTQESRTIKSINVVRGSSKVVNGEVVKKDSVIEVTDNRGNVTSLTIDGTATFGISATLISPAGKHLFYGWGPGDAIKGFIYDLDTNTHHEIGGVSVVSASKSYKWLDDGRFEFYRGCVTPECYRYVSVSSERPWEVKRADVESSSPTGDARLLSLESDTISYLKNNWPLVEDLLFGDNAGSNYKPVTKIQFIGNGNFLVRFETHFNENVALLNFNGTNLKLIKSWVIGTGYFDSSTYQETLKTYGNLDYKISTYGAYPNFPKLSSNKFLD